MRTLLLFFVMAASCFAENWIFDPLDPFAPLCYASAYVDGAGGYDVILGNDPELLYTEDYTQFWLSKTAKTSAETDTFDFQFPTGTKKVVKAVSASEAIQPDSAAQGVITGNSVAHHNNLITTDFLNAGRSDFFLTVKFKVPVESNDYHDIDTEGSMLSGNYELRWSLRTTQTTPGAAHPMTHIWLDWEVYQWDSFLEDWIYVPGESSSLQVSDMDEVNGWYTHTVSKYLYDAYFEDYTISVTSSTDLDSECENMRFQTSATSRFVDFSVGP